MPISADHIGRTYPAGEPQVITAEGVVAFAEALGDPDPLYRGPDALVPPTYVMRAAASAWQAMFDDPELDLQLSRTVHADQSFRWTRALRVGEVITPQLKIVNVRSRGAVETITIQVAIAAQQLEELADAVEAPAEPVAFTESTLIHNRKQVTA